MTDPRDLITRLRQLGSVTSEYDRQRLRRKFPWLDTTLTPREPNE